MKAYISHPLRVARFTLLAGSVAALAACTEAGEETEIVADDASEIVTARPLSTAFAVAGSRLVHARWRATAGTARRDVEIVASDPQSDATELLVDTTPAGPVSARDYSFVALAGKAYTAVEAGGGGSPTRPYLVETDGTPGGTRLVPLERSVHTLLACGGALYGSAGRIDTATGTVTAPPKDAADPGWSFANRKLHCVDDVMVVGSENVVAKPSVRRYHAWRSDGSLDRVYEATNASGYLVAGNSHGDEPHFIGERFIRAARDVYPHDAPLATERWKHDAWTRGFQWHGVVADPNGEARALFTDYDLATVAPQGSSYVPSSGRQCLYVTDGTPSGTQRVDSTCQSWSATRLVAEASGRLHGVGAGQLHRHWSSDGTVAGTRFEPDLDFGGAFVLEGVPIDAGKVAIVAKRTKGDVVGGRLSYDRQVFGWAPETGAIAPMGAPILSSDASPSAVNAQRFGNGIALVVGGHLAAGPALHVRTW